MLSPRIGCVSLYASRLLDARLAVSKLVATLDHRPCSLTDWRPGNWNPDAGNGRRCSRKGEVASDPWCFAFRSRAIDRCSGLNLHDQHSRNGASARAAVAVKRKKAQASRKNVSFFQSQGPPGEAGCHEWKLSKACQGSLQTPEDPESAIKP
jgi:hypothetical protein